MGFPVGYSELPKLLLHLLILLSHLRRLSTWLLSLLGLEPPSTPLYYPSYSFPHESSDFASSDFLTNPLPPAAASFDLDLLNQRLPVITFADLAKELGCGVQLPDGCAVCLHEFEGPAEVRRPIGCRHVFHRGCLDRWAAHGRRTCPLCRAPLVPDECHVA